MTRLRGVDGLLFFRGRPRRVAAPAAPQPDLLGDFRALFGVFRRDHRVVRRQPPFGAILIRRQTVGRAQMPLQHLELLAVFEADQKLWRDRFADLHGGLYRYGMHSVSPSFWAPCAIVI